MPITKDEYGVPRNEFGVPVDPQGNPVDLKQGSGDASNPSFWESIKNRVGDIGDLYGKSELANAEAMQGMGEAEKDIAKNYGPAIAGAGVTSLLGPEAGYPTYVGLGALTQGLTKAGLNKLEGKDALNSDVAKETAMGAIGGVAGKALEPVIGAISRYVAPKLATKGLDATATELLEGILGKHPNIGPEVKETLENLLEDAVETNPHPGLEKQLENLFNKTPQQIGQASTMSPELLDLQMEVRDALGKVSPIQSLTNRIGNMSTNFGAQALTPPMGNMMMDKASDLTSRLAGILKGNHTNQ